MNTVRLSLFKLSKKIHLVIIGLTICSNILSQFAEDYFLNTNDSLSSITWRKNNKIKTIQLNIYENKENKLSEEPKPGNLYEFDINGYLIQRTYNNGKYIEKREFDNNYKLVKKTAYKGKKVFLNHEFNYDSLGRIKEELWQADVPFQINVVVKMFSDQKAVYSYDRFGRISEVMVYGNNREYKRQRFMYNDSNILKEIKFCFKSLNMISNMQNEFTENDCSYRLVLDYDSANHVIKETVFGLITTLAGNMATEDPAYNIEYSYENSKILNKKFNNNYNTLLLQSILGYDLLKHNTLKSMYYAPKNYFFPFDIIQFDKIKTFGNKDSIAFKYNEVGDLCSTMLYDKKGILKAGDNYSYVDHILTKIAIYETDSNNRISKKEEIKVVIEKYD